MKADRYPLEGKIGNTATPDWQMLTSSDPSKKFSGLKELVRESKSSWADIAPKRKTHNDFFLFIAIAVIVLAVGALISNYQQQLIAQLDAVEKELYEVKRSLARGAGNAAPVSLQGSDNEVNVAALVTEVQVLSESSRANSESINSALLSLADRVKALETGQPGAKGASGKTASTTPQKTVSSMPKPVVGAIQTPGTWFVNIGTFSNRTAAEKQLAAVQAIVKKAQLQNVTVDKRVLYRVRASGFSSQPAAELQAQHLQSALKLDGTWVGQQK
ncbi:MAG: hypothetical protein DRR06_07945 [Gammaproteobacteria bacterium]|nr:MAG: hypothetical protein DRR06_07945 [Gammaproteobacteria bacterium]RLA54343.1 MAG: hypothetical protein DRR42_02175 [Gammaproteobacteria bacterium]